MSLCAQPTGISARRLLRFHVPPISPVNLVLAERLGPELLQEAFTPAGIVAEVEPLLELSSPERKAMLEGYGRLREALGEPGVTQRAASAILDQVQQAAPCP